MKSTLSNTYSHILQHNTLILSTPPSTCVRFSRCHCLPPPLHPIFPAHLSASVPDDLLSFTESHINFSSFFISVLTPLLICTCLAPRGETLELFKIKRQKNTKNKTKKISEHSQDLRGRSKKKKRSQIAKYVSTSVERLLTKKLFFFFPKKKKIKNHLSFLNVATFHRRFCSSTAYVTV